MPHFRLDDFTLPPLPQTVGEVTFVRGYRNDYTRPDWLIEAHYEEKKFFLWAKPVEDGYLLKSEKATRPAPNYYIQQALSSFVTLLPNKIVSSNLPSIIKKTHLEANATILKSLDYFIHEAVFDKPLAIEVGFGSGRHLLYQAKKNPHILYIGIEIHKPSIEQVIKQVSIQELQNVLLLNYDARIFLEFLPSNSVQNIYVHFPVPWDKKPTRRVISHAFIEESARVLAPQGTLELRTDSENYFAYALQTFLDAARIELAIKKNTDAPITSKYEDRWRLMEKNIYDIIMTVKETSLALAENVSFDFHAHAPSWDRMRTLLHHTIKSSEGFVHIERLYGYNCDNYLLRLSMGSYERPQQLYLKAHEGKLSYFPHLPLASKANVAMHAQLSEVFYG